MSAVKAMCDRLVRERQDELLATGEARARFEAYLDGLERDYPGDLAMLAYVRGARRALEAGHAKEVR